MNNSKLIETLSTTTLILTFIILMHFLHADWLPTVFADEWIYSSSSRLLSLKQSTTPSFLYLLLYKTTNYFGEHFLTYARLLNAILFSLATPFIYSISRLVVSRPLAMFIATLSLLSPINSYTAYFMPESMYYFSFWLLAWFVLTKHQSNAYLYGCGIGLILCLMSLIKMHAIFLLPAIIIFLVLISLYKLSQMDMEKSLLIIYSMVITFLLTRLIAGYLFAGEKGLNFFGEKYNYNFHAIFDLSRIKTILQLIISPMAGHLMALMLLLSLPCMAMLTAFQKCTKPNVKKLAIFTIACISTLLVITLVTTVQTTGWGPYEDINRIHMRYYNFLFPLFYILAGAEFFSSDQADFNSGKLILTVLTSIFILFSIIAITWYSVSFIDCPELFGLINNTIFFKLSALLAIICLGFWCKKKRTGAALYLFLFLPLSLIFSSYYVTKEIRNERVHTQDAYDKAGQFAHEYLGSEASNLVIVGKEQAGLYKTLFYVDNAKTIIRNIPENMPIELANIPADKKWILLIGTYPVLTEPDFFISKGDYTLICRKMFV